MTRPGSSPSTGPDLAALREKAEYRACHSETARDLLAILSLVDDLRAENERLREALTTIARARGIKHAERCVSLSGGGFSTAYLLTVIAPDYLCDACIARLALVGSPAEKEQTDG